MSKFALILAVACSQSLAFAAESEHYFVRQMRLSAKDSQVLYAAMLTEARVVTRVVNKVTESYTLKEAQIGEVDSGFHLRLVCEVRKAITSCDAVWITQTELAAGMSVQMDREFSRDAAAALSVLEDSLTLEPFALNCQMPKYVVDAQPACELSIAGL